MGALVFVCPVTGQEVITGIEIDATTLESLYHERVSCPLCRELHPLSALHAWIAKPEDILSDQGLAAA